MFIAHVEWSRRIKFRKSKPHFHFVSKNGHNLFREIVFIHRKIWLKTQASRIFNRLVEFIIDNRGKENQNSKNTSLPFGFCHTSNYGFKAAV